MMPYKSQQRAKDLPDDPIPRCGYFWISTGPNDPMIPCCEKHDQDYVIKKKTRKEVDKDFRACMLNKANKESSITKQYILRMQAHFYYGIVRTLGWAFW